MIQAMGFCGNPGSRAVSLPGGGVCFLFFASLIKGAERLLPQLVHPTKKCFRRGLLPPIRLLSPADGNPAGPRKLERARTVSLTGGDTSQDGLSGRKLPGGRDPAERDPKEGSDIVSHKGDWIANCLPDRVERISAASIYLLQVGPPRPNQLQNMEDLLEQGMVGLYRTGKKAEEEVREGQALYLKNSPFTPSPSSLKGFLGPMSGSNS